MNAGVQLVQAYLHLNGYFTLTELPVIRRTGQGYEEVTDLDILAVRFPWAAFTVPGGRPGPEDDLELAVDTTFVPAHPLVDVIIGEVKEGKARVNDSLRTQDALLTALRRVGCGTDEVLAEKVEKLRRSGEVHIQQPKGGVAYRVRILAFGHGRAGRKSGYEIVPLSYVAQFIERYLDRYHDVLLPSDLPEPVLGILHLLKKVR